MKHVIVYVPGSILPAFLGLASSAIFTRVFDAAEFGKYSLILSITLLITTLFTQWLQQAITRYLPTYNTLEEKNRAKYIIVGGLCLIEITLIGLIIVLTPFVDNWFPKKWQSFFLPTTLLTIGTSLFSVLIVVLQAEMRPREYTYYNIANSFLKLLLSLFIVFFLIRKPEGLVWGPTISAFIFIPLLWQQTKLPFPFKVFNSGIKNYWSGIKEFAGYGLPMVGWFLSANLLRVGDRYVIQWFRGESEVGIYSANYDLIIGAVGLLSAPVLLAAHPFLMKAWGLGDKEQTGKWLEIIADWVITSGILMVSFTWLFSKDIVFLLLGPEFREGYKIMPIVMAGVVVWQLGMYAHKPLEFIKATRWMMGFSIAAAALNIIMNIVLIPKYGYVAAAYTTLFSYLFYNIAVSITGKKIILWKLCWKKLATNLLVVITGIVIISNIKVITEKFFGYLDGVVFALIGCIFLTAVVLYHNGLSELWVRSRLQRRSSVGVQSNSGNS